MQGCLAGVTIIDLGQIYNAPYGTLLMAQAGATVIKVEPPGGERNRKGKIRGTGAGLPFYMLNSNKLDVTLNLKHPQGRELFLSLVDKGDVVVENFRPGVMEKFGLGSQSLCQDRPRLVYASSTGFGRNSRQGALAAMDVTIQAMSGVMSATGYEGDPPVKCGAAIADFMGGVSLYAGVVTALYQRTLTGRGAIVEASMMDSIYPSLIPNIATILAGDSGAERLGNRDPMGRYAPYNMYSTSTGHVVVAVTTDQQWSALAELLMRSGLAVPSGLETMKQRLANLSTVDDLVGAWCQPLATQVAVSDARASGVPCAPVRHLADVVGDKYFRDRGLVTDLSFSGLGTLPVLGSPLHFEDEAAVPLMPTPELGQHNSLVYQDWLGLDAEELEALQRVGAV